MKNFTPINRFLSLSLIASLILLSGFMTLRGLAEEGEEVTVTEISEEAYLCAEKISVHGKALIEKYKIFLDAQGKDPNKNSEKLDIIFEYQRYIRDSLENKFTELALSDNSGQTFTTFTDEYNYCNDVLNKYLLISESMLNTYYLLSTSSKTSFVVVDGFKSMNEDLKELNFNYHSVFPSFFNKFNNAFPCYINNCVSR